MLKKKSYGLSCTWTGSIGDNLELQWSLQGMFQLDKFPHLRSALERKGSQMKQTERVTYFSQHAEASRRLQDPQTASLED